MTLGTPPRHDNNWHKDAIAHLAATDADLERLIAMVGPYEIKLHAHREPFEALVRAIAHQQLHGRAAEAILGRLLALFPYQPFPSAEDLLNLGDKEMRACGFSAAKTRAVRGIAAEALAGTVPTSAEAAHMNDDALIARLTTLRGVGRWTVEMLLIFTLDRRDVLPVDDFGVREGWRLLKGLPEQPKPKAFAEMGLAWRPYRTTAAWYLWQAVTLGRTGIFSKEPPT